MRTIIDGVYPYTDDLLTLSNISMSSEHQAHILQGLARVKTPLVWEELNKALAAHPDHHLRDFLLTGIRQGFRISCNPHQPLNSAARNMQSALVNPKPVTEYLHNELKEQRVAGPLTESLAKGVHVSRFGLIPKRHQ